MGVIICGFVMGVPPYKAIWFCMCRVGMVMCGLGFAVTQISCVVGSFLILSNKVLL